MRRLLEHNSNEIARAVRFAVIGRARAASGILMTHKWLRPLNLDAFTPPLLLATVRCISKTACGKLQLNE